MSQLLAALHRMIEIVATKILKSSEQAGRHRVGTPGTVYFWALMDRLYGAENSQEIVKLRTHRETNGFLSVEMILGGAA